jgi:CheY-like chemotaxis protein
MGLHLVLFFAGEYKVTEDNYWYLLFVDDEAENCELAAKYLDEKVVLEPDEKLKVDTEVDFNKALDRLEFGRFDFVVLDVRLGPREEEREEEEGIKVLESIKARCFIPVIFYTGLPQKVRHLETPLIKVLENTEGLPKVLSIVKEILSTRIPLVNRALLRHVKEVQRDYMWDFIAGNWEKFGDTPDKSALAYLLARRLAKSLDGLGIEKLAERLGDPSRLWCDEEHVHPMRYYVIPPISPRLMSGDIFVQKSDEAEVKYLILLSPTCDIPSKVEWMLFARCLILTGEDEYARFKENPENSKKIEALIKDRRENKQWERFKFMPGALDIPDMIVDFQQLVTLKKDDFEKGITENKIERIASLDSPYCEALASQFARYFGRVGTPDLNEGLVVDKLRKQIGRDTSGDD